MTPESFVELFSGYFVGVPDSQLAPISELLIERYGISSNHIIAANEGNAVAIAAGWYLSTGKIPVVYMQNSGIGNAVNPVASLLNNKVYGIPCIFIVGWRGEPGVKDEPQHIFQGEITPSLLELIGIKTFIIEPKTEIDEIKEQLELWESDLNGGCSVAFIVKKAVFKSPKRVEFRNDFEIIREKALEAIVTSSSEDMIVSTTGKISRELYEIRERRGQSHKYDFLSVGSMGHSSSIAMAIAEQKPLKRIWCIDGDGAALMHMGAMAIIGSRKPQNLIHIVLNNAAHESVGGMPTVAANISFTKIALGCGYPQAFEVSDYRALEQVLHQAESLDCLTFIEIKCKIDSRKDLGRPTLTPEQNKAGFLEFIRELE